MKDQVTRVEVKNSKLFGGRYLTLHSFSRDPGHKDLSDDFIDSLNFDRYGSVFVDNIPKHDHRFTTGDVVHYRDGLEWIRMDWNRLDWIRIAKGSERIQMGSDGCFFLGFQGATPKCT